MAADSLISLQLGFPGKFLDDPGQRAAFVLLIAFLLSFLFIRTSTRLIRNPKVTWWPGNVETRGGLHVHHLVWGILLMVVAGFMGFAMNQSSPSAEVLAALFGIGAGLTFDEFALWIHLKDVYWTEEGRASLNAVVVAAVLGALIVLGAGPFDLPRNGVDVVTLSITIVVDLLLSAAAILKGKPALGLIGIFIPIVSLLGAIRLASPGSYWARKRYRPGSRKLARAQARWKQIEARRRRFGNLIGGAPGEPSANQSADDRDDVVPSGPS